MIPSLTRFGYISAACVLLFVLGVMILAPATATRFALQVERLMAGLEQHSVEVDGFEMPYLAGGEGPTLLLLHGFTANKDNFSRVAKHLTRDFHVVIPDLPGFGEASAPQGADYGLDAQVARVAGFVEAVSIEEAAHVGGNSMGGYIAASLALAHPDKVASLWLLAPAGLAGEQTSEMRRELAETGRNPLLVQRAENYADVLEMVFHEPPFLPWFVRDTLAGRAAERFDHYTRIFEQIYDAPALNERVAEIQAPTLLVWGAEDRVLHPSGAKAWMEQHPDSELQMLAEIGHLPMMEAPETVAKALLSFHAERFGGDD
ncbi:alpha/beta fold hydrolase [Algiphilus aromaticivorans]|uniref:alpha/beta fold hydrolase n=1 Tax=Algiphilus aromaticivorans TaxID=382454 RepID=UPI00069370D7|nr:alpha/beta fold hydrolase [Algiphilus aromaticivorans]